MADGGSDRAFAERGALEFEHDFAGVRTKGPELFYRAAAAARAIGFPVETADHIIPHQANGRMAELFGRFRESIPNACSSTRIAWATSAPPRCGCVWPSCARRLHPGESVLALGAEATKYMFGGFHYLHG